MIRFVGYWALAGLVVPLLILLIVRFGWDIFAWPYLVVVLWPSSIQLMALEAVHQPWWWRIVVPATSIAINVVLYSAFGSVLWLFSSWISRIVR